MRTNMWFQKRKSKFEQLISFKKKTIKNLNRSYNLQFATPFEYVIIVGKKWYLIDHWLDPQTWYKNPSLQGVSSSFFRMLFREILDFLCSKIIWYLHCASISLLIFPLKTSKNHGKSPLKHQTATVPRATPCHSSPPRLFPPSTWTPRLRPRGGRPRGARGPRSTRRPGRRDTPRRRPKSPWKFAEKCGAFHNQEIWGWVDLEQWSGELAQTKLP